MNKLKVVIVTLALVVAGTASAALLTTYVTSTAEVTVEQSVMFADGSGGVETSHDYTKSLIAGQTHSENVVLVNQSGIETTIVLVTDPSFTLINDGIKVTYWQHITGDGNGVYSLDVTDLSSVTVAPGINYFQIQIETSHALNPDSTPSTSTVIDPYTITTSINPVL